MSQHIEMIVDYLVVGDDFQYSDNHGVIIRCKDCRYWSRAMQGCPLIDLDNLTGRDEV